MKEISSLCFFFLIGFGLIGFGLIGFGLIGFGLGHRMLNLENISLGFESDTPLVSALSLSVPAGEMGLIQGPSGVGKSTLLSIIAGVDIKAVQWTGRITLNGQDISHLPPQKRQAGLMFQDPLLFPHLTVAQNLAFGLSHTYHGQERHERITSALQACDMAGFEDRDPASLSGGQKARIGLMRCMLAEPQLLLMDESFSALDPDLRKRFGRFVADQITKRNIPALLVSHHDSDAELADGPILVLKPS